MRAALLGRLGAALDQQRLDFVHGEAKILVGPRPARRVNAGLAAERIDHQTGIVGESRLAGGFRRGHRLDARIGGKCLSGFLRLGEPKLAGRLRGDAERRQQLAHFGQLAGIVRGDDDRAGELATHATASFCKPTSFSMPLRASASSARNCSSLNGIFFGGGLDFDNIAGAGHHEIGVGVGFRIFGVIEIEHGGAFEHAAGDGGDVIAQHFAP